MTDVVYQAGYADQPHLTRSLKHFVGQTPAQIIRLSQSEWRSFLFNPRWWSCFPLNPPTSPHTFIINKNCAR
ncbi:MAG: hypothetical protein KJ077_49150 [Anaerolineae bacterium]|nr:hypothetical protein [Anaerolineae bacterium]